MVNHRTMATKKTNVDAPDDSALASFDDETPFPDPVELPLEDVLDLHPFLPKEIRSVVEEYLLQCCDAGFSTVRLIHGKGKGVQRESIRALLTRLPYVRNFHDAPLEAGSWGATIVYLQPDPAPSEKKE